MDAVMLGHETDASFTRISWAVLACVLMAAPAHGDELPQDRPRAGSQSSTGFGTGQEPSGSALPGPRSFRLGFTPDDLLSTPEVGKVVYETLSRHADLVAFHLGQGVPWEEALNEQPFPPA